MFYFFFSLILEKVLLAFWFHSQFFYSNNWITQKDKTIRVVHIFTKSPFAPFTGSRYTSNKHSVAYHSVFTLSRKPLTSLCIMLFQTVYARSHWGSPVVCSWCAMCRKTPGLMTPMARNTWSERATVWPCTLLSSTKTLRSLKTHW